MDTRVLLVLFICFVSVSGISSPSAPTTTIPAHCTYKQKMYEVGQVIPTNDPCIHECQCKLSEFSPAVPEVRCTYIDIFTPMCFDPVDHGAGACYRYTCPERNCKTPSGHVLRGDEHRYFPDDGDCRCPPQPTGLPGDQWKPENGVAMCSKPTTTPPPPTSTTPVLTTTTMPQTSELPPPTPSSPIPRHCSHNGQMYGPGQVVPDYDRCAYECRCQPTDYSSSELEIRCIYADYLPPMCFDPEGPDACGRYTCRERNCKTPSGHVLHGEEQKYFSDDGDCKCPRQVQVIGSWRPEYGVALCSGTTTTPLITSTMPHTTKRTCITPFGEVLVGDQTATFGDGGICFCPKPDSQDDFPPEQGKARCSINTPSPQQKTTVPETNPVTTTPTVHWSVSAALENTTATHGNSSTEEQHNYANSLLPTSSFGFLFPTFLCFVSVCEIHR